MSEPTDAEAARAIKVAEGIVEVLATEADTDLAFAGLAMAIGWLATTRSRTERDAQLLVAVLGDTAREQTADLYAQARQVPEVLN